MSDEGVHTNSGPRQRKRQCERVDNPWVAVAKRVDIAAEVAGEARVGATRDLHADRSRGGCVLAWRRRHVSTHPPPLQQGTALLVF